MARHLFGTEPLQEQIQSFKQMNIEYIELSSIDVGVLAKPK